MFAEYAEVRGRAMETISAASQRVSDLQAQVGDWDGLKKSATNLGKLSKTAEAALDKLGNDDRHDLIAAVLGGAQLAVAEIEGRMVGAHKLEPERFRLAMSKGSGPLADALVKLGEGSARPWRGRLKRTDRGHPGGWRVLVAGTVANT